MIEQLFGGWLVQQRIKMAVLPEKAAVELVQTKGYSVIGTQVRRDLKFWVNSRVFRVEIRTDLLMTRHGRRYAGVIRKDPIETGAGDQRRLLLDLQAAFRVNGVLQIDTAGKKIALIEFNSLPRRPSVLPWILMGTLIGLAVEYNYQPSAALLRILLHYCFP